MSRALSRFNGSAVPGIEPFQGWTLLTYPEDDGDAFTTPGYAAVKGDEVRYLNTSRFNFHPTQERFAWIVLHSFPSTFDADGGPLTNHDIDCGIYQDVLTASARRGALHTMLLSDAIMEGRL